MRGRTRRTTLLLAGAALVATACQQVVPQQPAPPAASRPAAPLADGHGDCPNGLSAPDSPVSALVVNPSNDPLFATGNGQYGLHAEHADFETAWTAAPGYDGAGVTIAVVDSGVHASHEDLDLAGKVLQGADFMNGDPNAVPPVPPTPQEGDSNWGRIDHYGHGTHVAGIAAAEDNDKGGLGGAPEATILPVRVLNATGAGQDFRVAAGIDWAVSEGAAVINLSLGGQGCLNMTQDSIHAALAAGVVVVAAAGNCGNGPPCSTANAPIYPAAGEDTDLIAAGATDISDERAAFSNFNSRRRVPLTWPQPIRYIDVAAPGAVIVSTYKNQTGQPLNANYQALSGTSMATPHVAAAAALLIQRCGYTGPGTPAKVKAMLEATADPSLTLTDSEDLGAGLIKVDAATAATQPCL